MLIKRILPVLLLISAIVAPSGYGEGIIRVPVDQDEYRALPLVGVNTSISIFDQIAVTTIRDVFTNEADSSVDGVFHFPIPHSASVTGYGIWYGDSLVEYELKPGEQGGAGGGIADDPELREYLGSNPFSAALDSIPPGVFMVHLQYVQLLPYDFGQIQFIYPLYTSNYFIQNIDTVSIRVNVESRREIMDLVITDYEELSEYDIGDQSAYIALQMLNVRPRENWGFNITYSQEDIGAWLYAHRSNEERDGYFMLVIEPGTIDTGEVVSKNFTFVVDRSGSMAGNKIAQAKNAILACLNHLIIRDRFNIIDFSTGVHQFNDEMLPATAANLADARNYVNRLENGGGTNIYDALMLAIGQEMDEGSANQIVFATDGHPTSGDVQDPSRIADSVRIHNIHSARIFSFGIGSDLDARFINRLADENGGIAIIFNPNEARIDSIIADFYQYVARPTLINPEVEFDDNIEIDSLYPLELQDVAAGKQLYLFGRYSSFGEADLRVRGQMIGGDTTLTFEDMSFPETESGNEFVPRMWAKSVIDYWLNWIKIHGEDDEIIELIIQLSLEYGILTPYTEFKDPDDPDDPHEGIEQPYIASFDASPTATGVDISWSVTGVSGSITYNVYRSVSRTGPFVKLNREPLSITYYHDGQLRDGEFAFYKLEVIANDDERWMSEPFAVGQVPGEFILQGPYPNPFNNTAWISFSLPRTDDIHIAVYDMNGRFVKSVLQGSTRPGVHHILIDGADMAAGMYWVRIEAGKNHLSQKFVLLK